TERSDRPAAGSHICRRFPGRGGGTGRIRFRGYRRPPPEEFPRAVPSRRQRYRPGRRACRGREKISCAAPACTGRPGPPPGRSRSCVSFPRFCIRRHRRQIFYIQTKRALPFRDFLRQHMLRKETVCQRKERKPLAGIPLWPCGQEREETPCRDTFMAMRPRKRGNMTDMEKDEKYMREAIRQAKKAEALMEVPIGCVIVFEDKIIARGYNRRNTDKNTISHAEMNAIRKASKKLGEIGRAHV